MRRGTVIAAEDRATMWRLLYKTDDDGLRVVNFGHRPFAYFYEGATGRPFFDDCDVGRGRSYISQQLRGLRIAVVGGQFSEIVYLED